MPTRVGYFVGNFPEYTTEYQSIVGNSTQYANQYLTGTYGSAGDPFYLSDNLTEVDLDPSGGSNSTFFESSTAFGFSGGDDFMTVDGVTQAFTMGFQFNQYTLTFADGTSQSFTEPAFNIAGQPDTVPSFAMLQSENGDTYLFAYDQLAADLLASKDLVSINISQPGLGGNSLLPPGDIGEVPVDEIPDGPVDGEDTGEVMAPGYNDGGQATDGGGDIIDGADGINDTIFGNGGDDSIDAGLGQDTVYGGSGDDTIDGNSGDDLIYGDGQDSNPDGSGAASGTGGTGGTGGSGGENFAAIAPSLYGSSFTNDDGTTVSAYTSGSQSVPSGQGPFATGLRSGDGTTDITFTEAVSGFQMNIAVLSGNSIDSEIMFIELDGERVSIADLIASGDATLTTGSGGPIVTEGDGIINTGTNGSDAYGTLTITGQNFTKLTVELDPGDSSAGLVNFGNGITYSLAIDTAIPVETVVPSDSGEPGDDVIDGGEGNDTIYGNEGHDTIDGGADNDLIYGDGGATAASGGSGGLSVSDFGSLNNVTFDSSFTNDEGNVVTQTVTSDETLDTLNYVGLNGYWIGNGDSAGGSETHTHSFSEPVAGVEIRFNAPDTGENITFILDGERVDLNELIASGDATFDDAGIYSIDADGALTGDNAGGQNAIGTLTIKVPFETLTIENISDGASNGTIYEISVFEGVVTDLPASSGDAGEPGDDVIDGGEGNDTIFGNEGDDSIDGGTGNDTIYGDDGTGSGGATVRESFEWNKLPDPDGGGQIDDGDTLNSATQNTGNVNVSFETLYNLGASNSFADDTQNVAGIDTGGESIDTDSGFLSNLNNSNDGFVAYGLNFDKPVENVDFRINDADGSANVKVVAYDENDNEIPVTYVLGSGLVSTAAGGFETATFGEYGEVDDPDFSALVEIAGPVSRIVINHNESPDNNSGIWVSDVYFDVADGDLDSGAVGNDTIDGGADDDLIYGEGGDDSIDGGSGDDTIYGDSGSDGTTTQTITTTTTTTTGNAGGESFTLDSASLVSGASQAFSAGDDAVNVTYNLGQNWTTSTIDGDTVLYSQRNTQETSVDLTFDAPVENVRFEVLDIDEWTFPQSNDVAWDDRVIIEARDADGNLVNVNVTGTTHHAVYQTSQGTVIDGQNFENGVQGSGASDSVYISIPDEIVSLSITYDVGEDWARTGAIGVSDITFTTSENLVEETVETTETIEVDGTGIGGDDTLIGGEGSDEIYGEGGDDTFVVSSAADGDGDVITGGNGPDDATDNDVLDLRGAGNVTIASTADDSDTGAVKGTVTFASGETLEFSQIETILTDPTNTDPDAQDDDETVAEDGSVTFDPLGNDTDADGDDLTVVSFTDPEHGTLVQNGDGTFTYTPDADYNGPDSFTYTVDDGNGGTDTATVNLTVTPVNDAPVAEDDAATTDFDTPVVIPVLGNDTDVDGDDLTVTTASSPNGDVVINDDGTITFTPEPGFEGETTIEYTVSDGNGGEDTAAVTVTVNDQPLDGVVEGTDGADLIDVDYVGDPEGDMVDNDDAILPGEGPNDDIIDAGAGNDTVYAGEGDDDVSGDQGDDLIFGEDGDDSLDGGSGEDTLDGGEGDDTLLGGDDSDTITGGEGSDSVLGEGGDDLIDTGNGDVLPDLGYPGLFTADNDPENDRDFVDGGSGNDTISTGDDADTIIGGSGADIIDGGIDADSITGDEGADRIVGGEGSDTIEGGEGDDTIHAGNDPDLGLDILNIEDDGSNPFGPDLVPNNGQDLVFGGAGNDLITGADDDDTLYGGDDNDTIDGGIDDDLIDGGADDDSLIGGQGDDTLIGGTGEDALSGGSGDDSLSGGADRDTFTDLNAGDTVDGGSGGDDFDVLDLTGSITDPDGDLTVTFTGPDSNGNGQDGFVTYFDADGNETGRLEFSEIEEVIPCFTPGTLIATPQGEVAVETLKEGDQVITRDNGLQTIRWAGARTMTGAELSENGKLRPVLIRAGALGKGQPQRDMIVSPNHRVLVNSAQIELLFEENEVLVAAKHLMGLEGIERLGNDEVTYIHIMFDQHEVVLSDGAWTESFQPGDMSLKGVGQDQREEILAIFPELATRDGVDAYVAARRVLKKHEAALLRH